MSKYAVGDYVTHLGHTCLFLVLPEASGLTGICPDIKPLCPAECTPEGTDTPRTICCAGYPSGILKPVWRP